MTNILSQWPSLDIYRIDDSNTRSRVDGDAGVSLDPLEEGGDPGEGSWVADLAAEPGPEAGDADLAVLACTVLYSTVLYCVVLYCTALYCTV